MGQAYWTINLLGSLSIQHDDVVITRFRTKQTGALLAMLAYYECRPFRREELIEILWPDSSLESGRNCLRLALSALRRQLEAFGQDEPFVIADRTCVQLKSDGYRTDKAEFEQALKLAKMVQQDEARVELLTKSIAIYRGDLLPGYDEDWIVGERQRLANAYQSALRNLIKLLAHERHYEEALEYARRAVATDPLREESHRILMRLYLMLGQPAAALRQFQLLEQLLRAELGVSPSDSSRELARECTGIAAGGAAGAAPPAGMTGTRTPPASTTSPRNVRSDPPDRSAATSAVRADPQPIAESIDDRATAAERTGLPGFATRFFGREDNIGDIVALLDRPEVRLVTLLGFGGTGKTRIAAEIADRLNTAARHQVWFVSLAALSDARLIPDAIADALGLARTTASAPLDDIADSLAVRPALLVLDNFEQLAEEGAATVQYLLSRVPRLQILVTSRRQLKLTSEYVVAVPPLATPSAATDLTELMQFPVIQLFVDRVRRTRLNFQLTAANAAAIAALCQRLDGLPLAIELAASWAQTLSPAQMLARLVGNLPCLVSHNRDMPDRHTSLWKAIDWSYEALPLATRRFFARLAVFRGTFTLEATEAVCQEVRAYEPLTQLQELSLLSVQETEQDLRFFLPETLREYAEYQLADGELAALERRHADYYLKLAEEADPNLRGPDVAQWLDRLDREIMNIRAAVQRFVTDPTLGLRLTGALWRYWYLRGRYQEGYCWLVTAIEAETECPIPLRIKALGGAGNIAYSRCDYAGAQKLYAEALTLARESDDRRMIAAALGSLGNIATDQELYTVARNSHQEALAIYRAQGDDRGTALTLANLANIANEEGDFAGARDLYEESTDMLRNLGAAGNLLVALTNYAWNRVRADDDAKTYALLAEFLTLNHQLDNRACLVYCVEILASLAIRQTEFQRAAQLLGAAESLRAAAQILQQPKAKAGHSRNYNQIRSELGEIAFTALWESGHQMDHKQVTTLIMEILELPAH